MSYIVKVYRQLGDFSLGRELVGKVLIGGSVSWGSATFGKCHLEDFNLTDFLGTILIIIHFFLMNATNEHYFLNKIYSINTKL